MPEEPSILESLREWLKKAETSLENERAPHQNPTGASSIELFFDLVFVFVIT